MDGGRAEQPAARGTGGQFDFAKGFTGDAFDAVVVGQQAVDEDVVALEKLAKPAGLGITQEVGEGFIDLPTSGGANALVKFSMQLGIELEEVQSLHVQPLMHEAGNELIGTRIGQEAAHLSAQRCGFAQGILFSEGKQLRIRRSAPEKVGQPHGQLTIGQRAALLAVTRFVQVEETGRGKNDAEGRANRDVEGFAGRPSGFIEPDQFINELGVRLNLAEGFDAEALENVPRSLFFGDFGSIPIVC